MTNLGRRFTPEHRAALSAALKRYAARPDAHHQHMPRGEAAARYTNGSKRYRERCFAAHGDRCLRCGQPAEEAHHRNRDHRDNRDENLEPLCASCHDAEHRVRVAWRCVCGTTIHLQPAIARRRKYCSRACKMAHRASDGTFGGRKGHDR